MFQRSPLGASVLGASVLGLLTFLPIQTTSAAGTLTSRQSGQQPIQIRSHHVDVVLNNGFARTEVQQTFHNPNPVDLEAIYAFPLPKSASLSEMTIFAGELTIEGEVVEKKKAREVYEQERDQGSDSGLAEKNGYQTFEFSVSPVRAGADTRIRFVYYQPLEIDTGIARYLYPLEDGGTDEEAMSFWTATEEVKEDFSISVEVKSAWPIDAVRVPGRSDQAQIDELGEGHYKVRIEQQGALLNQDFVLYYALKDDLPGRVELIPFRDDATRPGHFMMVVTPGLDLKPLTGGSDYTFVLDTSGSMKGKLQTLARGITRVLGEMQAGDRYRIISFSAGARDLTGGFVPVSEETVVGGVRIVESLQSGGGTNLFDGLKEALNDLDADRATSIVLVTDGVANLGITQGKAYHELMQKYDVRVFGFLLGNNANWPLMRTICDASGGFSAGVSNADDIIGQLVLAKSKVTHECLHDARLKIKGVKVFDTTDELIGKVYRGQQLVFFGRYEGAGRATVTLDARLTGEDQTYRTTFDFPEIDAANPEIERLYALAQIEAIQALEDAGLEQEDEARQAIADLGVRYQLVTDHTSMLVLADEGFERHGIERANRQRVARERAAQTVRTQNPPQGRRVDGQDPMFQQQAPSRRGAGAVDPFFAALALLLVVLAAVTLRPGARS